MPYNNIQMFPNIWFIVIMQSEGFNAQPQGCTLLKLITGNLEKAIIVISISYLTID